MTMRSKFASLAAAAMLLFSSGCVVRELIIKSDPPGATVYINGREEGRTPLVKQFDFYGAREIILRMKGRKSSRQVAAPGVPWFEYFPLDFFFEIFFPLTLHDRHEYSFKLEPLPERLPENILDRARKTQAESRGNADKENGEAP